MEQLKAAREVIALARKDAERIRAGATMAPVRNVADNLDLLADLAERALSLPEARPGAVEEKSNEAVAVIENGAITITLLVKKLPIAIECMWAAGYSDIRYKVTDADVFAKEFVRALNRESEDGTTAIHKLFDAAALEAIDQGAEGIEEHEEQEA